MSPVSDVERGRAALLERPPQAASTLHRFAQMTAGSAFVLLFAGGLVTSTGSSLSVPDWPLSFGKMMPPMIGGVAFEHGHRLIAGLVAALTLGLTAWLRASEPRAWVRRLGYAAAGGILLQALLGGATVLLRLPPAVSISHACLGQAVFCLLLAIAQATSPWFSAPAASGAGGLWKTGAAAVAAVYVQLIFGALLRHTGHGLAAHVLWACAVAAAVLLASTRGMAARRPEFGLVEPSSLLSVLVTSQLVLGYFSYRARFSLDYVAGFSAAAATTAAHLAVGAALLGAAVVWTMRARRCR